MDPFLKQVVDDFARMRTGFRTLKTRRADEVRVEVGRSDVYFGWFVNRPLFRVDIDINFTAPDRELNLLRLRRIAQRADEVREGVEFEFEASEEGWEPSWTCAGFSIPYSGGDPPLDRAPRVAQIMRLLIDRTLPALAADLPEPKRPLVPDELIFVVKEDDSGGFTARAIGHSIFTQADTRGELEKMVRDAVRCHFEPEQTAPKLIHLHYVHDEVIAL